MLDPITQTIADILYVRTTLRLPPQTIKDRKHEPDAPSQTPMPAEKAWDSPSINRGSRRSGTSARPQSPWRWAVMMAMWRFSDRSPASPPFWRR